MTDSPTKITLYLARFQAWRAAYFPERQLFLRSQGRVRFLTIHSYTQMAISAALLGAVGWGAVTSYAYLTRDKVLENKNRTISTMSSQYKTLSNDFSALEAEVERRAMLLEERQRFLEEMLEVDQPAVETVADEQEAASGPQVEPAATPTAAPEQQSSLFNQLFAESSANAATPSHADRRGHLLERLRQLEARQREVADTLLQGATQRIEFVDQTLAATDLTSDDLLSKSVPTVTAIGGPFVPDITFDGVFDVEDGQAFALLKETENRLKMVTNALDSYPVGKPAEKYYISSRFGRRQDPFKKTWARHYGLDMAGWPGTAITATAPGTVVYAGWYGPYGNMVEIDHGNGFRTRYGHMRKLRVKKNEQVDLGQQVGDMGKTGRATDTHVHYEVWFDDKVRDPMPFIKAAENVLKIQGRHEETNE